MSAGRSNHWWPTGRALHLVDIENLAGAAHRSEVAIQLAGSEYRAQIRPAHHDHIWVGCTPAKIIAARVGLPGARLLPRPGPDGGETILIDELHEREAWNNYHEVIIASGDGRFAPVAASLRLRGLRVTAVARPGSLSRSLRKTVHAVRWFGQSPAPCSNAVEAA